MVFPWLAAAAIGSAVVGAVSSNSATKTAAKASQAATDAQVGVQNRALDLQEQNTANARRVGDLALNSLADRTGLSTPTATASANPAGGGSPSQPAAAPNNWQAYLDANPDVAAEVARGGMRAPSDLTGDGVINALDSAALHYQNFGQNEGRQPPAATPAPGAMQSGTSPPLMLDPALSGQDPGLPGAPLPPTINAEGVYTGARPEAAKAPVYTAPTLAPAPVYKPPEMTAAPTYVAPEFRETAVDPLDVSLGEYEQSPDFNFQLDQGNRNILANASAVGGLESGAALKALQSFGQNLAMGDYGQWRDYRTGQYNQDRSYTANRDDAYNTAAINNAQFGSNQANNQWQYGNTFNQNNSQFGANLANDQWRFTGAYDQSNALAKFNADQGNYQFGTNVSQNNYNNDRAYLTSRYDTSTNNLLNLAGIGQGAATNYNNALANNANSVGTAYTNNATNQGNAALAGAGQVNNLISNGVNSLAYYYGNTGANTANTNAAANTAAANRYGSSVG